MMNICLDNVVGSVIDPVEAELTLYRQMFDNGAAPAMLVVDPASDYRLLLCNPSARRLLAIDATITEMRGLADCVPALTIPMLNRVWREVENYGNAAIEIEIGWSSGQRQVVDVVFARLERNGQRLLAVYPSDISERKALEVECLRLVEEVSTREIELRYREIYENVTDGIVLLDVIDGSRFRYAGINPALARMTGLVRGELLDQFVEDVVPEDSADKMIALYQRCVNDRKPIETEVELDLPAGRKTLNSVLIPVRDAGGRIHRIIGLTRDITERKQAEQQIGLMNFSLDRMNDAVFLIDSQARFRYVNQRACESLGYSREELLTMGVADIDLGMDIDKLQSINDSVHAQGRLRFETVHIGKDARIVPVEISAASFDYHGEAMGLAVARDITERKQYDENLRKHQTLLSEAQRIAHIGSWELDLIDNILTWSDEVFRIFEIGPAQFPATYETFVNAVHPEDREAVSRAYAESLENHLPYQIEHRLLMADGRVKYVLERCETRYDEDGTALSSMGTVQDITERKRLEQALQQREFEFRTLVQNMPGILVRYDADCRFVYVNASFERMFGVKLDELRGKRHIDVAESLPDADFFEAKVRQAVVTGKDEVFEHSLLTADGSITHGLVHITPECDDSGQVVFVQVVTRDISERKQLEIQLQQQLDFQQTLLNGLNEVGMQMLVVEDGHIVYVSNRELVYQIGYSDADIDGRMPLIDLIHPDDRPRVMDYYRRRVNGEAVPSAYELGLIGGKGQRYEFEVAVAVVPNTHPLRIVTIGKDITERKLAEMERRQLHDVLAQSADFIGSATLERTVRYLNPAGLRMAGMPKDTDFSGMSIADFHPAWASRMMEETAFPVVLEKGRWRGESAILHRDGHEIPVSQLIMLHRDADGNPLFVSTIMTDITERKAAEKQLTLLNYALDRVGDAVALITQNADLVYVNQAFSHGVEYDREQMLSMSIPDIDPDYHHERWPEHWRELKANRSMLFETRHRTRSGAIFPVEVSANYFEYEGIGYNLALMRNITERKRTENTLNFVAQAGWKQDGESFLIALARYLGDTLAMDYVLVGKLADDPTYAETVVFYAKGDILPNIQYALKGTPCHNATSSGLCCYAGQVQRLFPDDQYLVDLQVESYAGLPLLDSTGKVIGVIALMDGKPIADVAALTAILQLVGTRVAAELERELSERALAESRQFLQQVIDTVADPIFVKDRQHRWLLLNRAFCRLMGLPAEALLGKSDYDFFPSEQADVFWGKDEEVFADGASINEEAFTDADGVTHTIVTSKTCFTDANGESILVGSIKDISALKQIQRDLQDTGNRLRSVLQTMPDYVWLKDPDGVYLACNHAFERLYGASEAEIVGKTDYDFVDAELADFFRQKDREAIDSGYTLINEEWVILAEDGSRALLETRKVPVSDSDGAIVGVLGIGRDITERKQQEERLALQDYALSQVGDAVYLVDEEARILQVNEAAIGILGYSRAELLAMRIYDLDPDFGPELWRQHWAELLARGTITLETHHRAKSGRLIPIEVNANFIVHQGRSYNFALVRDISERRQTQEAMQRSQAMLENAQRIAHIGSWDVDMVNDVLTWSDETFRIWEIDKTRFEATLAAFLETVHPEDREKVAHAYNQSILDKSLYQVEHRLLFPDGRVKYIYERGEPYFDEDGRPIRFIGTALDITDRKRAERELALLTHAVNLSNDGIHLFNQYSRIIYANDAMCNRLGYSREALLNLKISDIDPTVTEERMVNYVNGLTVDFQDDAFETTHKARDGRLLPVEISAALFEYDGERFCLAVVRDIAERKRVERELTLLTHAVNRSNDAIHLVDHQGRIAYANDAMCRRLGYSREELLQLTIPDVDPLMTEEMIIAMINQMHGDFLHSTFESLLRTRDGQVFPVDISTALFEYDGERFSLSVARDISERKQQQERLALLDYALDHVGEALYLIDAEARFIRVNEEACRALGYTRDELLAMRIFDIDPDFGPEQWQQFWQSVEAGVLSVTLETRHQTKDGRIFPVEISANSIHYQGRIYDLALVRDISERKRLETEARRREQEFRVLVESSPDPIFRYDLDCRRVYVNPAVEAICGKSAAELVGEQPRSGGLLTAREGGKLQRLIRKVLDTRQVAETEVEFIDPDGQVHYFHNRIAPEFAASGEVTGAISVGRNMTERRRAEKLLYQREREFRTLVENLPTYVLRLDRNLHRVYVNPAYVQSLGISEAELLGTHVSQFYRADNISVDAYTKVLRAVLLLGEQQEVPLEWTDSHGHFISHIVRIAPEFGRDGIPQGLLILGFDVTERRRQQMLEAERQRVFERVAHGDDLDGILQQVALFAEASKPGRRCMIVLLDEDGERVQVIAAPSFPAACRKHFEQLPAGRSGSCPGWDSVVKSRQRVIVEELNQPGCTGVCQAFIAETGARACWSEPVFSSSNRLLGVVSLYLDQSGAPDHADLALLLQTTHLSGIAIERKRIEQQMYRQASYDTLTGLPNRRLFGDRLREEIARAERGAYSLALLFIDLDRFKEVNDSLGHAVGDRLLTEAAQRIRAWVRESDTVARLAGDEFVVILPEIDGIHSLERVAQSIVAEMSRCFQFGEQGAYVSASIGIALYPQDADNAETLIGCADQAMYAAKEAGRNGFSFFTRGMLEYAQQRLQLAAELRDALSRNQLEVFYQPIIDIRGGMALKAEALLRWRHPELGMVPPDQFIPIAEETDLIQDIGDWVFRQAADTVRRWNDSCGDGILRQISVNVSPRQFVRGHPDVACIRHLRQIGLNPAALVIEITEGLLLDDQADIQNKLKRFHQAGMQLALDDFGTGYSAMAYLKKFNIDYLKIDRSFVRDLETDPGDRAIAEAIVAMAHRLGLRVIAEGVETEGQRDLLAAAGCEYVQGYLYAKPMPEQAFLEFVNRT